MKTNYVRRFATLLVLGLLTLSGASSLGASSLGLH